jgi:hypothetical protein
VEGFPETTAAVRTQPPAYGNVVWELEQETAKPRRTQLRAQIVNERGKSFTPLILRVVFPLSDISPLSGSRVFDHPTHAAKSPQVVVLTVARVREK